MSDIRQRYVVWMTDPRVAYGLIAVLYLLALLINLAVLPGEYLVSSLYAIPVLVAADRFSVRSIVLVGGIAVGLYLVTTFIKERAFVVVPFGVLGIVIVSYLAVLLTMSRQRAVEERERLQTFMGLVAHDLGQPATVIRGNAQILHRRARREQREADVTNLEAIDGAVRQMQQLIDDLQDASAVGKGEFGIRPVKTDLTAVVRQVVEEQQATAPDRHFLVEAPDRLEGTWDPTRLHQLFSNLVSNAVKYSSNGSAINVVVREMPGSAVVSVTDKGHGMSLPQQERLFRPFTRLDGVHGIKGRGLGLFIAKAIVDAHGGRIGIESEIGRGTTFRVALPCSPPSESSPPDGVEQPRLRVKAPPNV